LKFKERNLFWGPYTWTQRWQAAQREKETKMTNTHSTRVDVLESKNLSDSDHEFALTVLSGLSKSPKGLPSRFFYDDRGSDLFRQIMELPEYYPTQCEAEILDQRGADIGAYLADKKYNIVELGCGDGAKTILLFNALLAAKREFNYIPLDISQAAVDSIIENMHQAFKQRPFAIHGLVGEYFQGLSWLNQKEKEQNLVLFLGSNVGNFDKATTLRFMRHLWYSLNADDLVLIGFDLKKDLDVLYDAYNDSQGVTKEFNLNVLDRINKELGGNFQRDQFQHQGLYNVQTGAMESYLISQSDQRVRIEDLGRDFHFRPWEPIHMEYSYKYLKHDIEDIAQKTGFEIVEHFTDEKGYFIDSLWRVVKR
jgi:dimethylhistidine N-methyltransferase